MSSPRAPRARPLHALLLACALLFAVQLGHWHRIAHGLGQGAGEASSAKAALHSCAAFDAATLAERLPGALPPLAICRQRPPRAPLPAAHAASLPPAIHFSARAPPTA